MLTSVFLDLERFSKKLVLSQIVYSVLENRPDIKLLPIVHLEFPVACRIKLLFPDPVTPGRIKLCIL
jgi:hypothetical protein